ncbi:MAG: hypothetical protein HQL22_04185 [Candidatus Omnitrophica bacterium]|nr:hypothetical protein [Candidatus Omnitrophota bacterium]
MILFFAFGILMIFVGITLGVFLFLRPDRAIELQQQFYLKINWRIEPVNMPLEIRNTKIMAAFFIFVIVCLTTYAITYGTRY